MTEKATTGSDQGKSASQVQTDHGYLGKKR